MFNRCAGRAACGPVTSTTRTPAQNCRCCFKKRAKTTPSDDDASQTRVHIATAYDDAIAMLAVVVRACCWWCWCPWSPSCLSLACPRGGWLWLRAARRHRDCVRQHCLLWGLGRLWQGHAKSFLVWLCSGGEHSSAHHPRLRLHLRCAFAAAAAAFPGSWRQCGAVVLPHQRTCAVSCMLRPGA
jgi:hypothetical protein